MCLVFAFVHKTALLASLDALVTEEADDPASLSHTERQKREAEAMGDLLASERDEAALVWRGQREGLPVEHRSDCSPEAMLQVASIVAPRAHLQADHRANTLSTLSITAGNSGDEGSSRGRHLV